MSSLDVQYEMNWLKQWPEFWERPATMEEFLGPNYLNIADGVRPSIRKVLNEIFGTEVRGDRIALYTLAMITGGIGIGKTTVASIILPYMVHYVLCLREPQKFFGLLPGTRIAFMQMSTSEQQAAEVVFGDIKARIQYSPWFIQYAKLDPKYTKQMRFEGDVWVLPGDSAETTFEGYNILGGILDEADSHKVTLNKDYAEQGFDTIANRVSSRFDQSGFVLIIGQMKRGDGFASRKYAEFKKRDDAYAISMAIWESRGDEHYRCRNVNKCKWRDADDPLPANEICGMIHKFPYDIKRKQVITKQLAAVLGKTNANVMWIPVTYQREFEVNPEKALKDLAGVPPAVGDPFISMPHKVEEARNRWIERHWPDVGDPDNMNPRELSELSPVTVEGRIAPWVKPTNSMPRVGHLDIAYSADGDALGFSIGHVRGVEDIEGEMKPYIVIDLIYRVRAPAGGEVSLQAVRQWIYALKERHGFRLKKITMDGFQSTDTKQQFRKRRYETDMVSIDKDLTPYYDLRDALYEDRIELPPYMVHLSPGETDIVEICLKEMSELVDEGKKIEHPPTGSKDVADTIAGVVYTLMGDRAYRRGIVSLDARREQRKLKQAVGMDNFSHPAMRGASGFQAPIPPTWH